MGGGKRPRRGRRKENWIIILSRHLYGRFLVHLPDLGVTIHNCSILWSFHRVKATPPHLYQVVMLTGIISIQKTSEHKNGHLVRFQFFLLSSSCSHLIIFCNTWTTHNSMYDLVDQNFQYTWFFYCMHVECRGAEVHKCAILTVIDVLECCSSQMDLTLWR